MSAAANIRSHIEAIVGIASQLDPNGVDAAIADMPAAWDIASITGQRHGYGWHVILECHASGPSPVHGFGRTIGQAIRAASERVSA